jgi:filamentous hemagglutinin family protein
VVGGSATISSSGNKMDIHQHSDKAVIDWRSFDIGVGEHTQFHQPSANATVLNRVNSNDPSRIMGKLSANGNVVLVNPNGVFFGRDAKVDVNGLLATTANISNSDFMAGKQHFNQAGNPKAAVINEGSITAREAGLVDLVAPNVENHGVINARLGRVHLASGDKFALDLSGRGLYELAVSEDVAAQLVANTGKITAEGGTIALTAAAGKGIVDSLIRVEGELTTASVKNIGGKIIITGQDAQIDIAGNIDASGATKAGDIMIGGDYQGRGDIATARQTNIAAKAHIKANAQQAAGGRVIVWADDKAHIAGKIEAKGAQKGGFIETSGKRKLNIADTARVSTNGGEWLLDPLDFTIANVGGDITPATLQTNLGAGNVTIMTAAGAGNGDIFVNDAVSWANGNSLTLNASRHVNVNALISNSGAGSIILRADKDGVGTGRVNFAGAGALSLNTGRADLYYNPTSYAAPTNYAGNITGTHDAWMLVHNVTNLQNMNTNLAGRYALSQNIDATATSGWNAGLGFSPVGNNITPFTGKFDGQNYTISNLRINRPAQDYIGLFGFGANVITRNIGLLNANITGRDRVGGFTGYIDGGTISNSYATGNVSGANSVGGLFGYSTGTLISNSYATGNVSGANSVGGLIGIRFGSSSISDAYATGNVSGTDFVGGLVGYLGDGSFSNNYATGNVNGNNQVGGLVGRTDSPITNSYATGNVSGTASNIGGLVGMLNDVALGTSYSNGSVTGASNVGGLVGVRFGGSVTNSYWDINTSGQATSPGGGSGLTTAQMRQMASFAGFNISANGGSAAIWRIYEGLAAPLLRNFLTSLTVTVDNATKLEDGLPYAAPFTVTYSGFKTGEDASFLLGTLNYNYGNDIAAGTYAITPSGLYDDQRGYDISFVAGNLTITAPVVTPPPVVVTPPASAPAPAAPAPTPVVTPVITPAPVVAPAPAPAPVVTPVIAPIIEAAPTPTKAAFFIPPTVEQKSQQSMDNANAKSIIATNPNQLKLITTLEVMIREDLAKEFDVKPDKFWLKIIPNLK